MNDLKFLKRYEEARERVRKEWEYLDLVNHGCIVDNNPAIIYLRKIKITQEAFQEALCPPI